ncbi:uncharacterized protein VTP21DRAFT_4029 [Calcarisporiella thermophila]|uniref:uncharacterized protein n=1 Tax=Calcarisporiella thermophila TaxID=911321 RepID=UPI003744545E
MIHLLTLSDGSKMPYRILGEDSEETPLIMISGLGQDMTVWYPYCHEFAKSRQVLIFDKRGNGEFVLVQGGRITLERIAQDVVELANHLNWKDVNILGFSMGGLIAQTLVTKLANPLRIHKLILMGTAPTEPTCYPFLKILFKTREIIFENNVDTPDLSIIAATYLAIDYTPQWISEHREYFDQVIKEFFKRKLPVRTICAQADSALNFDVRRELQDLRIPTLIVHGEHDRMVSAEHAKITHQLISGSQLVLLPGVGHTIFEMYPEITIRIAKFLGEKVDSAFEKSA